jgi:hypothetical protein
MISQKTKNIILNLASRKGHVVYGQRAVNQQLPSHLKKKTVDYDIYTKQPERAAKELLKKLGNGDFEIKKAKFGRTWKVKNKKTGETIVDYTQPGRYPKTKNVLGVKYAELSASKRKIGKILRDEESKYRWDKDIETLKRIRQGEKQPW